MILLNYPVLVGEMAKKKVTGESISKLLGIHRNSVYNKLHGESSFTIEEALSIQNKFFPDWDINNLFQTEKRLTCMQDRSANS